MDINDPIKELGLVEIGALRDAILKQGPDAWHEEEYREASYEVHKETESIVLVRTTDEGWPNMEVRKESGWHRLADAAMPVMHDIIERWYPRGGTIIRAMAAKLLINGKIRPHRDTHPSFRAGHRIHVPITTNPYVRLIIDGRPYRFEPGVAYELNNQLMHSAVNKGPEDRVTFIFDYLPPGVPGRAAA